MRGDAVANPEISHSVLALKRPRLEPIPARYNSRIYCNPDLLGTCIIDATINIVPDIFCSTYTDHYRLQRNHTVGSIQRLISKKEGIADMRLENIPVRTVSIRWDE